MYYKQQHKKCGSPGAQHKAFRKQGIFTCFTSPTTAYTQGGSTKASGPLDSKVVGCKVAGSSPYGIERFYLTHDYLHLIFLVSNTSSHIFLTTKIPITLGLPHSVVRW